MEIKHCGKNGDRVVRLFQSPADLFVIQFVGNISEAVIQHAHGEIARLRTQGKEALIIDGQDTARLLTAYGQLTPAALLPGVSAYVLVEMLAGQSPFAGLTTYRELVEAKAILDQRLPELLPPEVSGNELLLNLCRRLIAPNPAHRFSSAQAADVGRKERPTSI